MIRIGDDSGVTAYGKGMVQIMLNTGQEVHFSNVLYCKAFSSQNLLSVTQITMAHPNVTVEFGLKDA